MGAVLTALSLLSHLLLASPRTDDAGGCWGPRAVAEAWLSHSFA